MKTWRLMMTLAATGLVAAACSEEDILPDVPDNPSTTTMGAGAGSSAGGAGSGGGTTSSTVDVVSTSSTGGGGPTSCFVQGDALLINEGALTGQGGLDACTEAQVDGFITACLDSSSTQAGCTAYTEDALNVDCVDCLFASDPATHWPVFLQSEFIYVQAYACESIVQGKPECAEPIGRLDFCAATACESCPRDADMDGMLSQEEVDALNACDMDAVELCAQAVTIPANCNSVFDLGLNEISATCQGVADPANLSFETLTRGAAAVICGSPAN